jgi:hypothetical protein
MAWPRRCAHRRLDRRDLCNDEGSDSQNSGTKHDSIVCALISYPGHRREDARNEIARSGYMESPGKRPPSFTAASKYTVLNGVGYLVAGAILIVWPGVTQMLFRESAFTGHEEALIRVIGLTVVVIGWLYLFGGRSGARQFVVASIIDRLVFVPLVLVPIAIAGVFPRLFLAFTFVDVLLAIGAWLLLARD